jgi:hypothetical protein
MQKEITVIKPVDIKTTRVERDGILLEIARQHELSNAVVIEIGDLEDNFEETNQQPPQIPMLIIRYLANLGVIIPICDKLDQNFDSLENIKKFFGLERREKSSARAIFGGLVSKKSKNPKKGAPAGKKSEPIKSSLINVTFDKPQLIDIGGEKFMIFNQTANVIGFIRTIPKYWINVLPMILSGNYNQFILQKYLFSAFGAEGGVRYFTNEQDMISACTEELAACNRTIKEYYSAAYSWVFEKIWDIERIKASVIEVPKIVKAVKRFNALETIVIPIKTLTSIGAIGEKPSGNIFEYRIWFDIFSKFRNDVGNIWLENKEWLSDTVDKIGQIKKYRAAVLRQDDLKEFLRAEQIKWVFIKKFGYETFLKRNRIGFKLLPRENKIIERELEQYGYIIGLSEKKHAWSNLLYIMSTGDIGEKIAAFESLAKYIPKRIPTDDYIRVEGSILMCPHVYDMYKNPSINLVKKYTRGSDNGFYYCKICGEEIGKMAEMEGRVTFIGDSPVRVNRAEDEKKEKIKKIVQQVVFRLIILPYQERKDIDWLIDQITERIYLPIELYEKTISKSKTMKDTVYKGKIQLFTTMYCYGYILKLIQDNPKKIFLRAASKEKGSELMNYLINDIIISLDKYIKNIPGANDEYIKNSFLEVVSNIGLLFKDKHVVRAEEVMDPYEQLITNPIVDYLKQIYAARYGGNSEKIKKYYDKLSAADIVSIDSVSIYTSLKNPLPKGLQRDRLQYILDYSMSNIFLTPRSISNITDGDITAIEHPDVRVFNKAHENLFAAEIQATEDYKRKNKIVIVVSKDVKPKEVIGQAQFLSLGYGLTKGKLHKHKWDIYHYVEREKYGGSGGPIVLRADEMQKKTQNLVYITSECSICGGLMTDSQKPNVDHTYIKKALLEDQDTKNFYNYFAFKCPQPSKKQIETGDVFHIFSNGVCTNCGFMLNFAADKNIEYYKKYYKNMVSITISVQEKPAEMIKDTPPIVVWKENPNIVNEFVNLTYEQMNRGSSISGSSNFPLKLEKTSYFNLINNLGLIEQRRVDLILSGSISPVKELRKNTKMCSERYGRLHSYIQSILMAIDTIINFNNISLPTPEIKILFSSFTDVDKKFTSGLKLSKIMENAGGSYYLLSQEIKKMGDHYITAQYTFEYMIKLITSAYQIMKTRKSIADEILIQLIGIIIENEKLVAKILENKEAAVNAHIASELSVDYDPNMIDNSQTRMYDDLVDPDAVDKYSYDDMDYDGLNDKYS